MNDGQASSACVAAAIEAERCDLRPVVLTSGQSIEEELSCLGVGGANHFGTPE